MLTHVGVFLTPEKSQHISLLKQRYIDSSRLTLLDIIALWVVPLLRICKIRNGKPGTNMISNGEVNPIILRKRIYFLQLSLTYYTETFCREEMQEQLRQQGDYSAYIQSKANQQLVIRYLSLLMITLLSRVILCFRSPQLHWYFKCRDLKQRAQLVLYMNRKFYAGKI